jgi:hypothetical protein
MDNFLRTGEYRFYEKYFDAYCFLDEISEFQAIEVIKFNDFEQICYDCDKVNKHHIILYMVNIKSTCREKLRNKEDEILITKPEFFAYIEQVVKDNDKIENEKDPELMELYEILKDKTTESIITSTFVIIIDSFELPINTDTFLGSLKKKDELDFLDFCCLFKKKNDDSSLLFETFFSSFYNTKEMNVKSKDDDNFPIKFNVKDCT